MSPDAEIPNEGSETICKSEMITKDENENRVLSHFYQLGGLFTIFMMIVNFFGSIAIVLCNKSLYSTGNIPPIFLASFQFFVTFCGLLLLRLFKVYQVKWVSMWEILPLCVAFCSFIVFTNISLKFNTVGTYQLIKCLSDPLTFFLQVRFFGKVLSRRMYITLTVITLGIFINYFTDVKINLFGSVFGFGGVVAASLYITWVGSQQEKLQLSPMQLLFFQSSVSSFLLALTVCVFELRLVVGMSSHIRSTDMVLFAFSGLLAFFVNTSVFYIIRHTSVITYAVFCKLKMCLIIWGAYALFSELMTPMQAVGTLIALTGSFYYSYLKVTEKQDEEREEEEKEGLLDGANASVDCPGK